MENDPIKNDVADAVTAIRRLDARRPVLGLILGSGLGHFAGSALNPVTFKSTELPGYPRSTVHGHAGQIILGEIEGRDVVILSGRVHLYEGITPRQVTFPIRLLGKLGVERLIVTNAAGGANPAFTPGTLMLIDDHINWAFANPLVGPNLDGGPRFPDMSNPYDAEWRAQVEELATSQGISLERGVYLWTTGPSYETKAEIRAFRTLGADAVGMSTVPEVIQANYLGMKVLGISTITNPAAGLSESPLDHDEVVEVGRQVKEKLSELIRLIIRNLE